MVAQLFGLSDIVNALLRSDEELAGMVDSTQKDRHIEGKYSEDQKVVRTESKGVTCTVASFSPHSRAVTLGAPSTQGTCPNLRPGHAFRHPSTVPRRSSDPLMTSHGSITGKRE